MIMQVAMLDSSIATACHDHRDRSNESVGRNEHDGSEHSGGGHDDDGDAANPTPPAIAARTTTATAAADC